MTNTSNHDSHDEPKGIESERVSDHQPDAELDEIVLKPATWQYDDYQRAKAQLLAWRDAALARQLRDIEDALGCSVSEAMRIVHGKETA